MAQVGFVPPCDHAGEGRRVFVRSFKRRTFLGQTALKQSQWLTPDEAKDFSTRRLREKLPPVAGAEATSRGAAGARPFTPIYPNHPRSRVPRSRSEGALPRIDSNPWKPGRWAKGSTFSSPQFHGVSDSNLASRAISLESSVTMAREEVASYTERELRLAGPREARGATLAELAVLEKQLASVVAEQRRRQQQREEAKLQRRRKKAEREEQGLEAVEPPADHFY
eukprot:TRINITY_DN29993_c0_g1_i1.p1 TRINITY_DN29993_c0_g1~~TRINITY_DN29993_c0_g1_i1.p1  ORF type:complete len:224 (+),score=51.69 TRINITY_DN29993_c0_g1_i1:291-962(+)